ncbi:DoxX family membrane protein [Danxiaibacter flavus]|uniref:DoxX family membrane protein n=1 Tax=Danxiaibacter flavus TaxID=3049108 RepID=A0ABV3ZD98_9BACT|nr:DoxX family membrane protein [Chitinophagaceae bacterium DXS]
MNTTSFLLLRLAIGASMLGHGLVRLPKLQTFSKWMTGNFEKSMLPNGLVLPFSYVLPVAEFTIGLLIMLGLFTRPALIAGSIVMIMLITGTALIENWDALPSQLIHVAIFAALINASGYNTLAIDNILFKK